MKKFEKYFQIVIAKKTKIIDLEYAYRILNLDVTKKIMYLYNLLAAGVAEATKNRMSKTFKTGL